MKNKKKKRKKQTNKTSKPKELMVIVFLGVSDTYKAVVHGSRY